MADRHRENKCRNKAWLQSQCALQLPMRAIATNAGCSLCNVRYWIKEHGLAPYRSRRERYGPFTCKCGTTDGMKFYASSNRYRCKKCAALYFVARARTRKLKIIERMGGKCAHCGWNAWPEGLSLHHLNPAHKDPKYAQLVRTATWDKVETELQKCVMLCLCCHIGLHANRITLGQHHGVQSGPTLEKGRVRFPHRAQLQQARPGFDPR